MSKGRPVMRDMDIYIWIHVSAAITAMLLTILQWISPKGTPGHRLLGYAWVGSLFTAALSSFAIHELKQFGVFSWIHGLSIYTLLGLYTAIQSARRGRARAHYLNMIFLAAGLYIAGVFAMLPGRRLGDFILG